MSNSVFKLMAFVLFLNISVGIMQTSIVDSEGNKIFDTSTPEGLARMGGLSYNSTQSSPFINSMETTVNANSRLVDKGNEIYRVLDMVNLGFIIRIIEFIKTYCFGFVVLLDDILGKYLLYETRTVVFGIFYTIISIGYIFSAVSLFTGKDITS